MRFAPVYRRTTAAGTALAAAVLLTACGAESGDDGWSTPDEWEWSEWFSFGDEDGEGSGSEDSADEADGNSEEETARFALPESCADIGAGEVAGGLAPAGASVTEDTEELDGASDAEQMSCVWTGSGTEGGDGESFAITFTVNADPSARLEVAQLPGEEEMNWEVDVDVEVDSYRTARSETLGGELDYVTTVEGSTQSLHLALPEDFYISAVAVSSEASRKDLEKVVFQAAERVEQ
ncbi:hypothetical protein FHX37_2595 [Haloactinospora alba]|uniref:DUF3558 domain-containing protein n=1 Tax=Haloactinospora alba TaxID=405555 RepID=A0A543NLD4_9ACTN|nr:hypothetical protein [Haloactinospora alba]TQN32619.1 hypothetical protein FHX37_2595 [Haloactinospora alba]